MPGIEGRYLERVLFCAELLAQGLYPHQVRARARRRFRRSRRAVDRYLRRAQALLRWRLGKPLEDLRAEALQRYLEVVQSRKVPLGERLQAMKRIDKILGLERPQVLHHEGAMKLSLANLFEDANEKPDGAPAPGRQPLGVGAPEPARKRARARGKKRPKALRRARP